MLIDLTPNEVMWINDMCARECARGKAHIDHFKNDERPEMKVAVKAACEIVTALAELGIKLCAAMEKENGGGTKLNNAHGRVALTGCPPAKSSIFEL